MFATLLTAAALTWTAPIERDPPERGPGYVGVMYHEQDSGFLVSTVNPGSPAEKAGLLANDIITKLDGKAPAGRDEFSKMVMRMRAGTVVDVEVVRNGGDPKIYKVRLGVRPADLVVPSPLAPNGEP